MVLLSEGNSMKPVYCCGGDIFESIELAMQYANHVYMTQGIILGIERVE
jgi:hypothetical protein